MAAVLFCGLVQIGAGADKSSLTETIPRTEDTNSNEAQQTLRSYLQLQEQLHQTLLTIERTRQEADAAAKLNAEAIATRLEAIEQSLSTQHRQEAALLQNSNRVTLVAAGIFAGLGLLAMIFTAWFLLRAMNRLAAAAAGFPAGHGLGPGQPAVLSSDAHLIHLNPVEQSSGRLLGVIERLEKRVDELEHISPLALPVDHNPPHSAANNGSNEAATAADSDGLARARANAAADASPAEASPLDRIAVIVGKGQSLLSLDKAEEAIACFDEAIALDPRHADALVKKGTALERLKRFEQAIECYDRAIAANRSMTLAYLYKGGVCNQLERFNEALECYEQALRSQQKTHAG